MLTVKHIDTDGTETIIEAERVERVCSGDHFADGVFLDREPKDDSPHGPTDIIQGTSPQMLSPPRSFKHVFRYCQARSSSDREPMVYVMNRFGATVATYHL